MGLFDYVKVNYPLPGLPEELRNCQFQTKSFDNPYLETYVIEAGGRLLHYETEATPENELPYPDAPIGSLNSICGIIRPKKEPECLSGFTGAVNFYMKHFEYIALYRKGRLLSIDRIQKEGG